MVLKTGGPCMAMKKDKEATAAQTLLAAVMIACGNTESHAWYAGPILCKGCYERDLTKKRKQTSAMNGVPMDAQSEEMQEKKKDAPTPKWRHIPYHTRNHGIARAGGRSTSAAL